MITQVCITPEALCVIFNSLLDTSSAKGGDSLWALPPSPLFQEKGEGLGCLPMTVYLIDRQLFFIVCFAFAHKSAFTVL